MQLQRRYNLPNCTLILEGLPDASNTALEASQRLSILLNAECHLAGHDPHIRGGKAFFTDLVTTVSRYAQFCLSGVPQPPAEEATTVRLSPKGSDRHQLEVTLEPEELDSTSTLSRVRTVDLTTVQLFDLVEAIDQFFADPLALPDFTLALRPVAKGTAAPTEPLAQRVLTPALGLATVAAAGFFFFNLPIPRVNIPGELLPDGEAAQVSGEGETPNATGSDTPETEGETTGEAGAPSDTIAGSNTDSPAGDSSRDLDSLEAAAAEALATALEQSPTIGDREQLSQLAATLFGRINEAWTEQPTFSDDLIYRAGVSSDGSIVGYRPENVAARTYVEETPLLDLLYLPSPGTAVATEPLAEFRLVFTPSGKLEVSPWHGYPPEGETLPNASPKPSPLAQASPRPSSSPASGPGQPIAERPQLETLTQDLYEQIDKAWDTSPSFVDRLTYQVTINDQGEILDYEAVTVGADRFNSELPLSSLKATTADNQSFGIFRVVFTPSGVLEVSPWDGLE